MSIFSQVINSGLSLFNLRVSRHYSLTQRIAKGEYRWLTNRSIETVLDIGANTGQFAQYIREILPNAHIVSFEPLPKQFTELEMLTQKMNKMECHNIAIGSHNGEATINVNDFSASSSLLPMTGIHTEAFPFTKNSTPVTIQVKTLDTFFSKKQFHKNILLKIDVQGYEFEVLKGANDTLSKIDTIIVETSFRQLYSLQPLFDQVYRYLSDRGFVYHGNMDQIYNPADGEVLQADSIFFRDMNV